METLCPIRVLKTSMMLVKTSTANDDYVFNNLDELEAIIAWFEKENITKIGD